MINKPEVVTHAGMVCFNRAGQVLLICVREEEDKWVFPKGHLQEGEDSRKAAERETAEETGIQAFVDEPMPLGYTSFQHKLENITVEWWVGKASWVLETPAEEVKQRDPKWVSCQEALELLAFESLQGILRKALCYPPQASEAVATTEE